MKRSICALVTLAGTALLMTPAALAAPRSRVSANISYQQRVRLSGHVHPDATAENDIGALDPTETLSGITLVLKPSAEQEADLNTLLLQQQDPASENYHKWLTPEQ